MKRIVQSAALITLLALTVGCGGTQDYGEAQPLVDMAVSDLADKLDISENEITVQEVQETEFGDTSLGVPKPGESYAQVITPGYIIILEAQDETYEYHGANNRVVLVPEENES